MLKWIQEINYWSPECNITWRVWNKLEGCLKVSAPANFQHFILPSKSFYSKFRWCNMHIWCSFSNIPSHLRENLLKSWLIYRKKKFSFPLLRKRTAGAQFDSSFQHQVLLMRWAKSIHCLDSLTNYRCRYLKNISTLILWKDH